MSFIKSAVFLVLFGALICTLVQSNSVGAIPLVDEELYEVGSPENGQGFESEEDLANLPEVHLRQRRATCDLGSFSAFGISLNHAACASHCILRFHKRGGHCNSDAVCVCRN